MELLGYQTNAAARVLQSGRSGAVGVLLRNVRSTFYANFYVELQNHASPDQYRIIAATANMVEGSEAEALDTLLMMGVDGLIIGSGMLPNAAIVRIAEQIPTVVVTRPAPESVASAIFDDPVGHAHEVITHLAELGHNELILVSSTSYSAVLRQEELRKAANERGLWLRTVEGGYEYRDGASAATSILHDHIPGTAVITLSYDCAVGLIAELQANGIRVPEDMSVVGADCTRNEAPFMPDVTGTVRDESLFAQAAWKETLRRLEDSTSLAQESRIPVVFHHGSTSAPA